MFSYNEYKNIIKLVKSHLPIKDFADITEKTKKYCVVRHDIEFSLDRAYELARIENERRSQIGAQLQAASEAGGGYQPTTTAQNVSRTSSRVDSSGGVKAYGLADGGLATMFKPRRR
jgi:hypothetical protein